VIYRTGIAKIGARSAVRALVVNGWDVQPTLGRAIARPSGRAFGSRTHSCPGPDPAPASGPPAGLACANWSSCRGQHRGSAASVSVVDQPRRQLMPTGAPKPAPGRIQPRHIQRPFAHSTQKSRAPSPLVFCACARCRANWPSLHDRIWPHFKDRSHAADLPGRPSRQSVSGPARFVHF
jgi:hypothetical protein